jgi:hypothetical protein
MSFKTNMFTAPNFDSFTSYPTILQENEVFHLNLLSPLLNHECKNVFLVYAPAEKSHFPVVETERPFERNSYDVLAMKITLEVPLRQKAYPKQLRCLLKQISLRLHI